MKYTTANELRTKSNDELQTLLGETKELVRALSFDAHTGRLKKVNELGRNKKLIARVSSVINEKNNSND